jgi:hypothetical protein
VLLAVLLHGSAGWWDEAAMTFGSVFIGLALAYVLKPKKKPDGPAPEGEEPTQRGDA